MTVEKPLFSQVRKYRCILEIRVSSLDTLEMDSSRGAEDSDRSAACERGSSSLGSDSTVMSKSI